MTKKEQIEEMKKAMEDFELQNTYKCDIELAEHLYNKGYRKVLIDTEKGEEIDYIQYAPWQLVKGYTKREVEKARKETAKEILILLGKGFDEPKMTEFKNLPWYKLFCRELKQKYGVDYHDYIYGGNYGKRKDD